MKKCIFFVLSLFLALCISTLSHASENQNSSPHNFQLMKASEALQITGEAKSINETAGTIIVAKKFGDTTIEVNILVDDATQIMQSSEKKTLGDIKIGDTVVAVYTEQNGMNIAQSISLE